MEEQGDPHMEQETQRQPQENTQKKLLWKSSSGWRDYSPTDRSGWPPTGRRVLATVAIVIALVSLSLIGYFSEWWPVAGQPALVIGLAVSFLLGAISLIGSSHRKGEWLSTHFWKAVKGNAALAGVLAALLAAVIGLGGVLYQQRVAFHIADQQRQETEVQTYFDDMGDLLLDTNQPLREAEPGEDVSVVAQAKTLSVLETLDSERKKSIVQFLYNAQLLRKDSSVVILRDADLREVNLSGTDLSEANLSGADLRDASLRDADLLRTDLSEANLRGADLRDGSDVDDPISDAGSLLHDADLSRADLRDAILEGAVLMWADLKDANLRGAVLMRTDLRDADLWDADLGEANLRATNLGGANLTNADLSRADLRGANLTDADFTNAGLAYADLSGARGATKEKLTAQARVLADTTLPDEKTSQQDSGDCVLDNGFFDFDWIECTEFFRSGSKMLPL